MILSRLVTALSTALVSLALPVAAGDYSGRYGDGRSCRIAPPAMESALVISGQRLRQGPMTCMLSSPVAIRGLNAHLFDAACDTGYGAVPERVMLMRAFDGGVFLIRQDQAEFRERC